MRRGTAIRLPASAATRQTPQSTSTMILSGRRRPASRSSVSGWAAVDEMRSPAMKTTFAPSSRQKGAVLILVGVSLAVLIGFLGLVIDLGRLFVTKTELQSAMDACALAATAELKPGLNPPDVDAITKAVNAGITAGTRNKVGFQAGAVAITPADIYFSDRLS